MSYNYNQQVPQPQRINVTSPWAIVSLISGIASFVFLPLIGAILAIIGGYVAKKEIRTSNGQVGGGGMATWGLILGWINIALGLITVCIIILMAVGVIGGGSFLACGPFADMMNSLTY
ncbi:MAG: DUF4190 domain-containing protein [Anaerolineaceae bacterium]|nr:DUF4190 domain-containing protein [Anaerolineaceae bacterium]